MALTMAVCLDVLWVACLVVDLVVMTAVLTAGQMVEIKVVKTAVNLDEL